MSVSIGKIVDSIPKISKIVEIEVTRRLEQRLKEKEAEEEERKKKEDEHKTEASESSSSRPPSNDRSLPSGVLTPLLKRHKDLDDELRLRLQELERKLYVLLRFFSITVQV